MFFFFFRSFTLCVFCGFIHACKLVTLMWATVSACAICLVVRSNFVFIGLQMFSVDKYMETEMSETDGR